MKLTMRVHVQHTRHKHGPGLLHVDLDRESQPPFDSLYENKGCMNIEACMRICIRTRVMHLMSDSAYAYAYGRLYI